jgi:hypothetical protein
MDHGPSQQVGASLEARPPPGRLAADGDVAPLAGFSAGRALALLFAVAVFLLAAIAALDVVADPHRVWGGPVIAPDPGDVRAVELSALAQAPPFDAVFIGDSRCQRQEPAYVAQITGWAPFNACQSGARVTQMRRALDTAIDREGARLRHVVVFIGPEIFRPGGPGLADAQRRDHLLNLSDARAALRVLAKPAGVPQVAGTATYARDGHQLASKGFRPRDKTAAAIAESLVDIRASWKLSENGAGWPELGRLLARAGADGRDLRVVVMPYNPADVQQAGDELRAAHDDFVRRLRMLQRDTPFRTFDAAAHQGAYPRVLFLDALHLDFLGQRRLADDVFGGS